MSKLSVCRACLATGVKLHDIGDRLSAAAFETVTGLTISQYDILPPYLCMYCYRLVQRSLALRRQCHTIQKNLYVLAIDRLCVEEQLDLMRTRHKDYSLTASKTETTNYIPLEQEGELLDIKIIKIESKAVDDPLANANVDQDIEIEVHSKQPPKQERAEVFIKPENSTEFTIIKGPNFKADGEDFIDSDSVKISHKQHAESSECNDLHLNTRVALRDRSEATVAKDNADMCPTGEGMDNTGNENLNMEHGHQCGVCGKSFRRNSDIIKHRRTHTGEKPYKCQECTKTFSTSSILSQHARIHGREKPHACDECSKSFGQRAHLTRHKQTHTQKDSTTHEAFQEAAKPYKCDICDKSFRKSFVLNTHKAIHTGEKPYSCDSCGKSFTQSSNLTKHQRTHTGAKPFQCQVCQKSFNQSSNLAIHKRTHTGEKLHKCDVCGKCFSLRFSLRAHRLVHTGERPHQCDVCGKSFNQRSYLATHKRTHTGDRPYSCEVCSKSFGQSSHLAVHRRAHSGERPCQCDVCDKRFSEQSVLAKHKRTHGRDLSANVIA